MFTFLVLLLVLAFYILFRNWYVYERRRSAIEAVGQYGTMCIHSYGYPDYDSELFDKALVSYEQLLFLKPFTFGKLIAITDEYKDIIEPYFED